MEGMDRRKQIGYRIRSIRKKLRQTQHQFAQSVEVTSSAISAYEIGDSCPSLDILISIAKLGDVSIGWLIMGETVKDESREISEQEILLLQMFRHTDGKGKEAIIRIAELAVAAVAKKRKS